MAVLIPGKLVYLATPHTASTSTNWALSELPGALSSSSASVGLDTSPLRVLHHATREEILPHCKGGELFISTHRHPADLVVTWYLRQKKHLEERVLNREVSMEEFVEGIDDAMLNSAPYYIREGKMFWHDADKWLYYDKLRDQLNDILRSLNLPTVALPRLNVTKGRAAVWKAYYTDKALDALRRRFWKEAKRFGYEL